MNIKYPSRQNLINLFVSLVPKLFPNKRTLDKFNESDTGELLYNGKKINNESENITIFSKIDNAIEQKTDGLYVKDLSNHTTNTVIHVTQDDKDLWNATLQNAKDYTKKLFDSVTSFTIEIVETLPTENIKTMTIYFMRNSHDNESDYYEEYMYINNKWEIIGSTFVNLAPYLLKEDFETYKQEISDKFIKYSTSEEITNTLENYAKKNELHSHSNKNVLDLLSDVSGTLNYNGIPMQTKIKISQESYNALEEKDDGLYVPKSTTLETTEAEIAELKKQNALLQEEINSLDSIIDSINRVVI